MKYYVVWVGREPGIYDNWEDARRQVDEFPGAKFKGFTSKLKATEAFRSGPSEQADISRAVARQTRVVNYEAFPDIDPAALTVDASCLGNPGRMEYRCVELATGRVVFQMGPFEHGTNNIGEYLAIVHALALLARTDDRRTIYTDSRTALSWLRRRGSNSKLKPDELNKPLLDLLARADIWVRNHTWPNRVIKWDTDRWGEIPADYDRK